MGHVWQIFLQIGVGGADDGDLGWGDGADLADGVDLARDVDEGIVGRLVAVAGG